MIQRLLLLLCLLLPFEPALPARETTRSLPESAPDTCPVTNSAIRPFVPPLPWSARKDPKVFWYGTDSLWTSLPMNGVWLSGRKKTPSELRLFRNLELWRQPYWDELSTAELVVSATRLDAEAPAVTGGRANNTGWLEETPIVLVPIRFPTAGCWQVTGRYEDREITFTVRVPE